MLQMANQTPEPVVQRASKRISLTLTIAVATSGLIIFAVTGFLGYCSGGRQTCPAALNLSDGPSAFIDSIFIKPWPLFLWLCALVIILQQSMLTGLKGVKPEVEQTWRRWTYAATGASIVAVGIFDLYGREIREALDELIRQFGSQGFLFRLISDSWFYTVVNFGVILLLAIGAVRRWVRFHDEQTQGITPAAQLYQPGAVLRNMSGDPDALDSGEPQAMAMHELVIGDVLVRSALVLVLSFVMHPEIIGVIVPRPGSGSAFPAFDSCSVALPGRCATQLSFLDLILALLGLVGSVAFAAVFAQAIVRQRVEAQEEEADEAESDQSPRLNLATFAGSHGKRASLSAVQAPTLGQIGRDVARELLKTLARPFQRVDPAKGNPYDPLTIISVVVWPLLVLAGVFGAATMARVTQRALHHTTWDLFPVFRVDRLIPGIERFPSDANLYELVGLLAGFVAVVAIMLAARIMTRKPETLAKGLEFIRDNGFMTLVLFCVYALALWLIQKLFLVLFIDPNQPPLRLTAFSFGLFTIGSFFLLLWFAVSVLAGRGKSRRKSTP